MFTYDKYRKIRDARGLTDYQVSCATGISRTVISQWKTGKHRPRLETLIKIGRYLDIPLEEVVSE